MQENAGNNDTVPISVWRREVRMRLRAAAPVVRVSIHQPRAISHQRFVDKSQQSARKIHSIIFNNFHCSLEIIPAADDGCTGNSH